MRLLNSFSLFFSFLFINQVASARDIYVAPGGSPSGSGAITSPMDIATVLGQQSPARPGDNILLRGGTYYHHCTVVPIAGCYGFETYIKGSASAPITVRPVTGERAIIDGGIYIVDANYAYFYNLEIIVSEPKGDGIHPIPDSPNATYVNNTFRTGGVTVTTSEGVKFINNILHDNAGGFGAWKVARGLELYGNLVYRNGYQGQLRWHGHGIYSQNNPGMRKNFEDNIIIGQDYCMQAYGSSTANVSDHDIVDNVCMNSQEELLVGGDGPAEGNRVVGNMLYQVPIQLGYSRSGGITEFKNNIVAMGSRGGGAWSVGYQPDIAAQAGSTNQAFYGPTNSDHPYPANPIVRLKANKYDSSRANLVILNLRKQMVVNVDLSQLNLAIGDQVVLKNPTDFYGAAYASYVYNGQPIQVVMAGADFSPFVLLHGANGSLDGTVRAPASTPVPTPVATATPVQATPTPKPVVPTPAAPSPAAPTPAPSVAPSTPSPVPATPTPKPVVPTPAPTAVPSVPPVAVSTPSPSSGQSMMIDFGAPASIPIEYNNAQSLLRSGSIPLKTEKNVATGAKITMVKPFNNVNVNGSRSLDASLKIAPAAGSDTIFGNTVWYDGAYPDAALELSGLDPSKAYSFEFFASVIYSASGASSENDETQYQVVGSTSVTAYLDAFKNSSRIATVSGMKPNANGVIRINVTKGPRNTNAFGLYYLGSIRVRY